MVPPLALSLGPSSTPPFANRPSHSMTKPPTEQPQPQLPEPIPPVPQILEPTSPSVSSSIDGSRLTTNPGTPTTTHSLKSSLVSSLSCAANHADQPPPPRLPVMSRQSSDPGGVLTNVWGTRESATASPARHNSTPMRSTEEARSSPLAIVPHVPLACS